MKESLQRLSDMILQEKCTKFVLVVSKEIYKWAEENGIPTDDMIIGGEIPRFDLVNKKQEELSNGPRNRWGGLK